MNEVDGFHWAWWIFFAAGFMLLPWNIGLCIAGYRWLKKRRKARKATRKRELAYVRYDWMERPIRYKHNLYPVMPLVTLADMEREELEEKGPRPLRKIDV